MSHILSVQDISCLGKCSLTVALPVLSAMGCSCSVLPTAVLSTHTAFPNPYVRELTGDMEPVIAHWKTIGAAFDAVLVGYLSDPAQVRAVETLWSSFDALRILDPAMGDHGKLYSRITEAHVAAIRSLCDKADLLIPNVTEACLLTGTPYRESFTEAQYRQLLQSLDCKQAVLTGVSLSPGKTGFMTGDGYIYQADTLPGKYHGTGDLFAAVCTGAFMQGKALQEAATQAAGFVEQAIKATGASSPFGLSFESLLPALSRNSSGCIIQKNSSPEDTI